MQNQWFSSLIKNSILVLGAILISLFVAEIAVRFLFPEWAPRTGRLTDFWQYDTDYGWSHVPGSSGSFNSHGFDTNVVINSAGFRSPEVKLGKARQKKNVLVLGDSYAWGFGVQEDETFASRLQAHCPEWEVINMGVSGYSTDQELLLFRDKGKQYSPELVILGVAGNDFESNTHSVEYVYYQKPVFQIQNDQLILTNQPVPKTNPVTRLVANVAKRSYLLRRISHIIQGSRSTAEHVQTAQIYNKQKIEQLLKSITTFPRTKAERITAMLVKELISEVERSGAKMLIVFTEGQNGRDHLLANHLKDSNADFLHMDQYILGAEYDSYHLVACYIPVKITR